ncbi:MAG: O-antigen ligase family protein [Kiritimatiellaeota bacterium]|nr:O-antigen ligase family protein [Kiritimatiellota bacterium]
MIQKVLTKYWLALHVTLLLAVAWGSAFDSGMGWKAGLLWLSFFAFQAFLLLPSMLKGETLGMARVRACTSAVYDPFVYVGVALVGVACIQWLNGGCTLIYVEDTEVWRYSRPAVGWLPFSIEPLPALAMLSFLTAAVSGGVVLRNGVGKLSRRFFLDAASMLSGCVAIYMAVMSLLGNQPYSGWSASPHICNWGTCFGFWMLVAVGGQLGFLEAHLGKTLVWSVLAVSGNLLGMLLFETPLGVVLFAVAALGMLIYWGVVLARQSGGTGVQRLMLAFSMAVALGVMMVALVVFIKQPVKAKAAALAEPDAIAAIFDAREFRSSLAWKMWQDCPWTGVGAGGFTRYGATVIEETEWPQLKASDGMLSNDWLQFLTEYGIIGTGLFIALVIVLLIPLVARLRSALRRLTGKTRDDYLAPAGIDPYVVSGIVAAVMLLLSSVLFSPLQSGATFASFVYVLAVIPGLLPAATSDAGNA